ncbi:mismatch-specific DNA-glycosylase [Rhodanobacter ginsengisoli]|uniref:Mismatch-specific DNA-glycosylase n=1 Tax=Rhodanobacter ginsengisoli TaxID=418646 RepID=A0ABW0QJZ6_9GAMM
MSRGTEAPARPEVILPDVLQAGLSLVFCGTAAGRRSAAERAYYAHPGNLFWRALFEAGLTPRQLAPADYPLLPRYGIGLTDLAKRHAGNDSELPRDAFDVPGLVARIERHRPQWLAFTSKNAARAALGHAVDYGVQQDCLGSTRLFVLPSPSGQARGHWSLEPWLVLGRLYRALQAASDATTTGHDAAGASR